MGKECARRLQVRKFGGFMCVRLLIRRLGDDGFIFTRVQMPPNMHLVNKESAERYCSIVLNGRNNEVPPLMRRRKRFVKEILCQRTGIVRRQHAQ